MATIGSFTASENGFSGTFKTLNLNVNAKIVRVERSSEDARDFRVLACNVEFGAGWQKQARESEYDRHPLRDASNRQYQASRPCRHARSMPQDRVLPPRSP
ncbi:DUF736 family protein [Rhizobium sp. BK538]|uniref:DUF736 domain-containing protein n=1 Tax=Rhizobium sp. BK538 TaxID=2586984 RepID=UPI00160936A2|nr:DUF736 family protein [Rhizobium sp. BK538]